MVDVISESDVLDNMYDQLIQTALLEYFLCDKHLAIDATHFKSGDASKPSEKKAEPPRKSRGRKTKEENKERTAVERVNAYLIQYFQLNNVRHRTGRKGKMHFNLVKFIYNACKLAVDRLCIITITKRSCIIL